MDLPIYEIRISLKVLIKNLFAVEKYILHPSYKIFQCFYNKTKRINMEEDINAV